MKDFLSDTDRQELKLRHRKERDVRDRMEAVMLKDKSRSYRAIAEALFLDRKTLGNHVKDFLDKRKTMATKVSEGWIRRGTDKLIAASAARTRLNIMGALQLKTFFETIWPTLKNDMTSRITDKFHILSHLQDVCPLETHNVGRRMFRKPLSFCLILFFVNPVYSAEFGPEESQQLEKRKQIATTLVRKIQLNRAIEKLVGEEAVSKVEPHVEKMRDALLPHLVNVENMAGVEKVLKDFPHILGEILFRALAKGQGEKATSLYQTFCGGKKLFSATDGSSVLMQGQMAVLMCSVVCSDFSESSETLSLFATQVDFESLSPKVKTMWLNSIFEASLRAKTLPDGVLTLLKESPSARTCYMAVLSSGEPPSDNLLDVILKYSTKEEIIAYAQKPGGKGYFLKKLSEGKTYLFMKALATCSRKIPLLFSLCADYSYVTVQSCADHSILLAVAQVLREYPSLLRLKEDQQNLKSFLKNKGLGSGNASDLPWFRIFGDLMANEILDLLEQSLKEIFTEEERKEMLISDRNATRENISWKGRAKEGFEKKDEDALQEVVNTAPTSQLLLSILPGLIPYEKVFISACKTLKGKGLKLPATLIPSSDILPEVPGSSIWYLLNTKDAAALIFPLLELGPSFFENTLEHFSIPDALTEGQRDLLLSKNHPFFEQVDKKGDVLWKHFFLERELTETQEKFILERIPQFKKIIKTSTSNYLLPTIFHFVLSCSEKTLGLLQEEHRDLFFMQTTDGCSFKELIDLLESQGIPDLPEELQDISGLSEELQDISGLSEESQDIPDLPEELQDISGLSTLKAWMDRVSSV